MAQRIRIQNFGPIEDFECEVKKLNVFIGYQATGKSTIAKCIHFFKSMREELISIVLKGGADAEQEQSSQPNARAKFNLNNRYRFVEYFGKTRSMPPFDIQYWFDSDVDVTLQLNDQGLVDVKFNDHAWRALGRLMSEITAYWREFEERDTTSLSSFAVGEFTREKERKFNQIIDNINAFFGDDKEAIFIPASKLNLPLLASKEINLLKEGDLDAPTWQFIERVNTVKKTFARGFDVDPASVDVPNPMGDFSDRAKSLLKGEFFYHPKAESLLIDTGEEQQKEIPLLFASSGQQELIWVLLILLNLMRHQRPSLIIIEEPEVHLYPSAQNELISLLLRALNIGDTQLIITTHSPYTLTAINNHIQADNAAKARPEAEARIAEIVPGNERVAFEDTAAFYLKDGKAASIMDEESRLINAEGIDEVADKIEDNFEKLLNLEYTNETSE